MYIAVIFNAVAVWLFVGVDKVVMVRHFVLRISIVSLVE